MVNERMPTGDGTADQVTTVWANALDEFEQRLDQYRLVLTRDHRPAGEIWPPAHLIGMALPAEHADRARLLLASARELEGELAARRDQLPSPRSAVRQRRTAPSSSFVTSL